jgi:hypothetical protein
LISNDMMDQIIAWIEMMWDSNQPVTFHQLREFIAGTWGIAISPNTLWPFNFKIDLVRHYKK